jgi:hypothetical protein
MAAKTTDTPEHRFAVQALIDYISELSEEAYCAGWMSAVEFALWRRVCEGPGRYGRLEVTEAHLQKLGELSRRCGGWVYWDDATDETFVPMSQWEAMYSEWKKTVRRPGGDW